MNAAPSPFNPTRCPLCGRTNQCALEIERATGLAQPPCWCTQATFEPETMARIPALAQGKACLCPDCAATIKAGR